MIDPETNNTVASGMVAGGMVTGKLTELGGLHNGEARVILSLPANPAEQIMAGELFASRSHEAEVRRMTAGIPSIQHFGQTETPRNRCGLLRWNTPHHPAIKVNVRWPFRGNRCPILPNPQVKALAARARVAIRH